MKKLLKIIGILVLVFVIIVSIAITMMMTMVDQKAIKSRVSAIVQEKTGRQLMMQGQFTWSFFPWLGFKINDVKLSNNQIFKNTEFVHIGELDVRVRLMPLISKRVEVDKFVLKNVDLTLIKNRAGYSDWQDLTQVVNLNTTQTNNQSALDIITIGNIEVQNGHIIWQNQQTNQKFEITKLNFVSNNINFSDPFSVQSSFSFKNYTPAISGDVQIQSKITLDFKNKHYLLHDVTVNGTLLNDGIVVTPLDFSGAADISADLTQQVLTIDKLHFKLADMVAVGSAKGMAIIDAPKFTGSLDIAKFDATSLFHALGLNTSSDAWSNTAFKLNFETTSKFLKLPLVSAQIGDMKLQGNGSYSHFDDKIVAFNIDINKLDFDRLAVKSKVQTPVVAKVTAKKSAVIAAKAKSKTDSDNVLLDAVRAIQLIGNLRVGNLKTNKIDLTDINVAVDGNHGLIACNPLSANFYKGKISGTAAIDLRNSVPVLTIKSTITGSSLQQLLVDFAAFDKVSGVMSINSNLTAKGDNGAAIMRSLNGTGKLNIENGVYRGMDIAYQVRKAHAIINQKPLPQESQPPQTNFGRVTANFVLNNSVLSTHDLLIQAADFSAKGQGSANLLSQSIDFQLTASSPTDKSFYVPIKITNTFANPQVRPDMGAIAQHVVEGAVKQQLQKQIEKQLKDKNLQENVLKALPLDKLFK